MASSTTETSAKRVMLVDDHPIVRDGLSQLLEQDPMLTVAAQAGGVSEALAAVAKEKPDLVVVGLSLADGEGMNLLRQMKEKHPGTPVLVLSVHDETLHAEQVLRIGARGYVMKRESTTTVFNAIHKVLRGEIYLSEQMASRLLGKLAGGKGGGVERSMFGRLSDRELQVFEMIGRGEPPRVIASRLGLSVKTVDAHRERIKEKLGVKNGTELMRFAVSYNLDRLG